MWKPSARAVTNDERGWNHALHNDKLTTLVSTRALPGEAQKRGVLDRATRRGKHEHTS